jgi:hypothetical protein
MAAEIPPVRRLVTGFDASGRSIFVEDGPASFRANATRPGLRSSPVWATGRLPVPVDDPDRSGLVTGIMPPPGGSLLKIVDLPPEPQDAAERRLALEQAKESIRHAGTTPEPGLRRHPDGPHPGMHETDTIDYAIVLSGEVYARLDEGERLLKAGDILIQRGTSHSWSNRSGAYCRIAFVLVEATR